METPAFWIALQERRTWKQYDRLPALDTNSQPFMERAQTAVDHANHLGAIACRATGLTLLAKGWRRCAQANETHYDFDSSAQDNDEPIIQNGPSD